MPSESVSIQHAIPGRVRVRVPRVRRDRRFAHEVRNRAITIDGVHRVEVRADTGSVILHYDREQVGFAEFLRALADALGAFFPGLELGRLEDWLEQRLEARPPVRPLAHRITNRLSSLDERVEQAAGGSVNLRVLVPIGFFMMGLGRLAFAKRVPAPAWYDFFWFSYNTFVTMNRNGAEPAEPVTSDD